MVDISEYFKNLKYEIKAVLFDWGDTVMKVFPDQKGPMFSWPKVEPISNIESLLEKVTNEFKIVLTSNAQDSDKTSVQKALDRINLTHYFHHIFTPQEIKFRKPDPQYYLKILELLSIEPENAVMIGDDYQNDIIAAKQVGLWTIWLNNKDNKLHKGSYPYHDSEVKDLGEIYTILQNKFIVN